MRIERAVHSAVHRDIKNKIVISNQQARLAAITRKVGQKKIKYIE